MAWLNTCDKGQQKSRRESLDEDKLELPDVDPFAYILDYVVEVGPIDLTWSDLKAWNEITGYQLSYWELITIKALAVTYTSSSRSYDGTKEVSPFVQVAPTAKLESSIRSALREPISGRGLRKQ